MTNNVTQQESALHRVADSILLLDATVRRLATDVQGLIRHVLSSCDRRERDMGSIQRDIERIQRDIDDLARQIGKARQEIEENSGPHPKSDDEWKDEPSVVVKTSGRWTVREIAKGVIGPIVGAAVGAAILALYQIMSR